VGNCSRHSFLTAVEAGASWKCPDEARGNEFDLQVPASATCADMWSSGLAPKAIEPRRALLRREETGASEVLTFSDVGSTSNGESAGWPGSSGSIPSMAGGMNE